jgi:hypothetical protein
MVVRPILLESLGKGNFQQSTLARGPRLDKSLLEIFGKL